MSLTEVLPSVQSLSQEDKRDLLVLLSQELSQRPELLVEGQLHSWWSPHNAHDAASILLNRLSNQDND
jgi:hypothetical protein